MNPSGQQLWETISFFTASQILSRLQQKRLKSFSVLRYHADYQRNDAPAPTLSPKRDMRLRKTSLKHSSIRHGFSQCGIPPWWVPLSLGFEKCSFGRFHSATSPPASREEKDMCKVICTVHSRKERGFSTLNAHGFEASKKAAVIKSCRPKGGGTYRLFAIRQARKPLILPGFPNNSI